MVATKPENTGLDLKLLDSLFNSARSDKELFMAIVNGPFDQQAATAFMFLGIIVFLLVNKKTNTINRIALSKTELADNTLKVSVVPFEEIKIPIESKDNIIASAIKTNRSQDTTDWKFLFTPALSSAAARINQASAGITYSAVYPFKARGGGALIFSYYQYIKGISSQQLKFMADYTSLVDKHLKQRH